MTLHLWEVEWIKNPWHQTSSSQVKSFWTALLYMCEKQIIFPSQEFLIDPLLLPSSLKNISIEIMVVCFNFIFFYYELLIWSSSRKEWLDHTPPPFNLHVHQIHPQYILRSRADQKPLTWMNITWIDFMFILRGFSWLRYICVTLTCHKCILLI